MVATVTQHDLTIAVLSLAAVALVLFIARSL